MPRNRREQRQQGDIWPGFVDALSTLLLVLIFVLVVFVLGQFFLNQLLQGKDTELARLEAAVADLTEQLDLEQQETADLRLTVSQLSADLQAARADREDALGRLAETEAERDQFRDQAFMLEDEKALLSQTLNELRQEVADRDELEAELGRSVDLRERLEEELEKARETVAVDQETMQVQLAQLIQLRRDIDSLEQVRADLESQVAEMSALLEATELAKEQSAEEIARLTEALALARMQAADLDTEVGTLRERVSASEQETASLEEEIARLSSLLQRAEAEQAASEQEAAALDAELEQTRAERGDLETELTRLTSLLEDLRGENDAREARVEALTAELEAAREESAERASRIDRLAARLEALRGDREEGEVEAEELRRARERLLVQLSEERDRTARLEARLAREEERTTLAQERLDERETRIAELLRSAGRTEEALATEQALSREALNQVEVLNRQVNALRVQLAALQQALEREREKVEEPKITIADLGNKLNMALASKVEELSRFRSEFFGRLREVLGDRPDVRIVGDRFVFQSEVLFPSASAQIEPGGEDELRNLAASIREIMAELPTDIPWVLQINGHTDRRPISTAEFPSNWELSAARAINVGKFLVREGIPPERIAVAGFAHFQPIDDRRDEIAYRRNRRIEIKVTTR